MTAIVDPVDIVDVPEDDWPTSDLYHSPHGLYQFQAEGIARGFLAAEDGGGELIVWDTGTGKSHFGMRMSTLLAEDMRDQMLDHDLTILVCEKGKVGEWKADFERYTRQKARIHHGPTRHKKIAQEGLPDVLVTTYETAKADLVQFVVPPGKRTKVPRGGPLFEIIKGKRTLWVFDEISAKLSNRSSANYKAFWWVLTQMRKTSPTGTRVFGLTATPIEKSFEDAFNQMRLIRPEGMPTVEGFNRFIRYRDAYDRPRYDMDLIESEFLPMARRIIQRKRKTDPDVVAQFPKKVEESRHLEMAPDQRAIYDLVESLGDPSEDGEEVEVPGLWMILRQVADHPAALVYSARNGTSALAKMLVDELGEERLLSTSSVKEQALVEYLKPLVQGQGAKVVVFTFFGQSVLPLLAAALKREGLRVYENHGGLSAVQMADVRSAFRADPLPGVFLTSDAGSRGINLPEATYVVEYESALTYANRTQRLDRIHRIDSTSSSVHCMTFIADGTIETAIVEKMLVRNRQTDLLLGDNDAGEDFMTSKERQRALQVSRLTRSRRKR